MPPDPPPTVAPPARRWARGSLIAPFVLIVLGYFAGDRAARGGWLPKPTQATADEYRAEIRRRVDAPPLSNLAAIYGRNFLALAILCLGIGTAGIVTGVQMAYLGGAVGAQVAHLLGAGVDGRLIFWFLFPHGVPEILAFCIGGSVGLHGTAMLIRHLPGGALVEPGEVRMLLRRAAVAAALLAVAGLVEVYITPAVGKRFLG